MTTPGKTLKLERVAADITIRALAARMGLSRQAVWGIERAATVDERRVSEYRSAVAGLRDISETAEI